jgi:hypothetical protein
MVALVPTAAPASALTNLAPSLGTQPPYCTTGTPSPCVIESRAGFLSISTHIVHPGGQYTVDFSPVEGFDDDFGINGAGLPGVPDHGCEPQVRSCTYQVPRDVTPTNQYVIYTMYFGTKQGEAMSQVYLAVVNHRALTGTVLTPSGKAVQGAEISFAGPGGELTTTTDHGGAYGVILSADTYNVKVVNLPGSDQSAKVSQCSGRVTGAECTVDLSCCDEKASFTEGGVTVTEVQGPGGEPASGLLGGGTPIVIKGSGFGAPGSSDQVNLVPVNNEVGGDEPIAADKVVVVDDSTIRAVTRDATAQMGSVNKLLTDVEVTAGGLTSPANPPGDDFTYERPAISAIGPTSASPAGGTELTITGQGFGTRDEFVLVDFCPEGSADIGAKGCKSGHDEAGGSVLHPQGDTRINVAAPAWAIPGDAGSAAVSVFVVVVPKLGAAGTSSAPYPFNYGVAITDIGPLPSASPGGGTELTITGHGFGVGDDTVSVKFCPEGSQSADAEGCKFGQAAEPGERGVVFRPLSDTAIKVAAPAWPIKGDAGSATVWVSVEDIPYSNDEDTTDSPALSYYYEVAIKAIEQSDDPNQPSAAPGGGTELTITGHGFGVRDDEVSVTFCPEGSTSADAKGCKEGRSGPGDHGIIFSPRSDTTILVAAPPWPIEGGAGSATVWVFVEDISLETGATVADTTDSPPYQFNYEVAITDVGPPGASLAGGTKLTITGHGFGVPDDYVSVSFCPPGIGVPATKGCKYGLGDNGKENFFPDSDTVITVKAPAWTIPPGGSSAVSIIVTVLPPAGPFVPDFTDSPPYAYKYA